MYILQSPAGRAGFILPPKTGTRSIENILKKFKAVGQNGRHGVDRDKLLGCSVVYASIRNPFDVLVSWYLYMESRPDNYLRPKLSFREWYDRNVEGSSNAFLRTSTLPFAELANKHIRFELGLAEQFSAALSSLGWICPTFPHIGAATDRGPYQNYYDPRLRDAVLLRYKDDFSRYEYTWD